MSKAPWSADEAKRWYQDKPWFVGCNFVPSSAINQLEMWQSDTFDVETIDRELGWAASFGFNSARVFLHDLVWQHDADGFKDRIDKFLGIAWSHGIHTMFVVFDDCWHPPKAGKQAEPVPGVHNSGWAQSPGHRIVADRSEWPRLEAYVKDVIGAFADDERICIWDLYNEPGNAFLPLATMPKLQAFPLAVTRAIRHLLLPSPTLPLLKQTFEWAREAQPNQPLTAPYWVPNNSLNRFQFAASDVISFHDYTGTENLQKQINKLEGNYGRPVFCTEFLARGMGSLFQTHLPIFKRHKVGNYCWGMVTGKTQTNHHWNDLPGSREAELWHHDVLHPDGRPYDTEEVAIIRKLTRSW